MKLEPKRQKLTYDVVIVGGGMTGLCAALASGRHGAKTALIHDRPVLGGNASSEIRMHICGASTNMKKPDLSEGGIVHELMLENKRVNDSYNFSIWDAVLFSAAKKEKNVDLFLNTTMHGATREGSKVKSIQCYQMTTEKHLDFYAPIFIDCTGNGTLSAFVGGEYRIGSEGQNEFNEPHAPKTINNDRMGNTLLFKAVNTGKPVTFVPPVEVMNFTEEQLKYRKHTTQDSTEIKKDTKEDENWLLFDGYCQDYGYWWIEIPGEEEDIIGEYEKIRDDLVKAVYGIWNHIKNDGDHGAENYDLVWVGMLPGVRESRRLVGEYILNENDVLSNRQFTDAVAYGGWHIDNHVPGGIFAFDKMPSFVYDFPGAYTIPYRSYCAKGFENLYISGRSLSASKLAMASSRVMGTCAIGGQAVGTAAALCIKQGCNPVELAPFMAELQQTLLRDDCYIPGIAHEDKKDLCQGSIVKASSQQLGFEGEKVLNGISRALEKEGNAWRSAPLSQNGEWIELAFEGEKNLKQVQITFDSNFHVEKKITLSSRRQNQQVIGVPPELVKDYDVELYLQNKAVAKKEVRNNYLRLNRINFEKTLCDKVKITAYATNGAKEARIFEVRAYEENER